MAARKLRHFSDPQLAESMGRHIEDLRTRALAMGEQTWGEDWVVVATV